MPSFDTTARSLKVMPIPAPVRSDVEIETAIIWAINLVGQPLRVQQDALLSLFAHLEGEALYLARELHDCCPDSIPILQRAQVVDARLNDFAQ